MSAVYEQDVQARAIRRQACQVSLSLTASSDDIIALLLADSSMYYEVQYSTSRDDILAAQATNSLNSPFSTISRTISRPPTSSPLTMSCGNVGQSFNFLRPVDRRNFSSLEEEKWEQATAAHLAEPPRQ